MTHADIYIKFMIEYDKANTTSSYPSFTKFEVATILNKAYLSLISGKVSGNNFRKVPFEYDTKAIADIQALINTAECTKYKSTHIENEYSYQMNTDMFYVTGLRWGMSNVTLVSHQIADKYKQSDINYPWIATPVAYIENNNINILIDPDKKQVNSLYVTYVKFPSKFTKDFNGEFELSDQMAEELINIAIIIATEQVESTRLKTITQTAILES